MNSSSQKFQWFVAALLGLSLFAVVFCFVRLGSKRTSAETAASLYRECDLLAQKIVKAREQPQVARLKNEAGRQEISLLIEESMTAAGLKPASLEAINPSIPERIDSNSPYLVQETQVQFGPLPTGSLVKMLYSLVNLDSTIEISQIQMTTPARKNSDYRVDRWMTQIVLTQLIFDPIRQVPSPSGPDSIVNNTGFPP